MKKIRLKPKRNRNSCITYSNVYIGHIRSNKLRQEEKEDGR